MKAHVIRHGLSVMGATALLSGACAKHDAPRTAPSSVPSASVSAPRYDRIERLAFNQRVAELDLPLFWRSDANGNKALEPDELAVLVRSVSSKRSDWIDSQGNFTPRFSNAYAQATKPLALDALKPEEKKRLESVALEL